MRVGALLAGVAMLATGLAVVPRPVDAQQVPFLTPAEPPSIAVDTMADCGGGALGIRVESVTVGGTPTCVGSDPASAQANLVRINRSTGEVVESCSGCGIGAFVAGQGTDMLVLVSSPSTLRVYTSEIGLLRGWGLEATNVVSTEGFEVQADFAPFSAVVVPGCDCSARVNQHAIADSTFTGVLRAGHLQGQLQRSADGLWTYVEGDFLSFDTMAGPADAPVIRMGEAEVALPGVDADTDGIVLAVFDAASGAVLKAPEVFPMSGNGVTALRTALRSLTIDVTGPGFGQVLPSHNLVVVQSVGRPVAPYSEAWENVADFLEDHLGATKTRLLSLNRPDTAGTEIPAGYTLIGRYRPHRPESLESVQQGSGQRVHLAGQLGRTSDSLLSPLTADSYGLTDPRLFQVAYAPSSEWPLPSSAPAMVWLRDRLFEKGYPRYEDVRAAYWATINLTDWLTWAEAVDGFVYDPGSTFDQAAFEQAQTTLHAELLAVHRVHSVLVAPSSLVYRVLTALETDLSGSIDSLAEEVLAGLPVVPPPSDTFVMDLVYSILSVTTAALGPVAPLAQGALDASEEVIEALGDVGKVMGLATSSFGAVGTFAGGGGEPGSTPFEQPLRREAANIASTLAASVQNARSSMGQLAGLMVSDHDRLAAASALFQSPRYVQNNTSAVDEAARLARVGAQRTVLHDILKVSYARSAIQGPSTQQPVAYPIGAGCTEPVPGSAQTLTVSYDGGSAERQAFYFRPKYPRDPKLSDMEPETPQALVDLLFSDPGSTVRYGNLDYPGSGMVPATFFPLLDDETERAHGTLCGQLALEGDISGWGKWAPGAAMQVMYGAGSATPVAAAHDVIHVRVSDSAGNAMPGVTVTLGLTGQGGVSAQVGGNPNPTAVTGPGGVAQFSGITAGSPGTFTATARAMNLTEDIRLTNLAYTSVLLSSDPAASGVGQPVTFRADVPSEIPVKTGFVTFFVDGVERAQVGVAADASASWTASDLAVGDRVITATYSGSAAHVPSNGTLTHTVLDKVPSTVSLEAPAEAPAGTDVTFTASVVPTSSVTGTRGGTVELTVDGEPEPSCAAIAVTWEDDAGTAACSLSFDTVAAREVVATYSGDEQLGSSASETLTHTTTDVPVNMLLTSPGPSVSGEQITLSAVVEMGGAPPDADRLDGASTLAEGVLGLPSGGLGAAAVAPDGAVSFTRDGEPIEGCTDVVVDFAGSQGQATCPVSLVEKGSYLLAASYVPGSAPIASASADLTQVVGSAETTVDLTSPASAVPVGPSLILTATVAVVSPGTGLPTGTVTFEDADSGAAVPGCEAVALGAGPDDSAVATCDAPLTGDADRRYRASYSGDADRNASTSEVLAQVVGQPDQPQPDPTDPDPTDPDGSDGGGTDAGGTDGGGADGGGTDGGGTDGGGAGGTDGAGGGTDGGGAATGGDGRYDPNPLPRTGQDILRTLAVASSLLVAGFALVLLAQRRQLRRRLSGGTTRSQR